MFPFLLSCYGMTLIVTQSRIFRPVREKFSCVRGIGYWIKCPMCFGFWAGVFWSPFLWHPIELPLGLLAAGCISSGFCWIVRVVLYRLGEDAL